MVKKTKSASKNMGFIPVKLKVHIAIYKNNFQKLKRERITRYQAFTNLLNTLYAETIGMKKICIFDIIVILLFGSIYFVFVWQYKSIDIKYYN